MRQTSPCHIRRFLQEGGRGGRGKSVCIFLEISVSKPSDLTAAVKAKVKAGCGVLTKAERRGGALVNPLRTAITRSHTNLN